MTFKNAVLAAGMVAAIGLGTLAQAQAHGSGAPSGNQYPGWHSGPMMGPYHGGQGYGMGRGMGPYHGGQGYGGQGYGGPGMMGPGYGGPGMMGPYHGGPRMMGPGYGGWGHGMGPMMGPGMMQPLRQDLTIEDVTHILEHRLEWAGNPNLELGKVEEKDGDTFVADIVTKDGSLVQRLVVDRHTGWMRPEQ